MMLTERDLRALIDYRPEHPVLSVFLDIDPSSGSNEAHRLQLRQMLKEFEEEAAKDIDAILRFMQHEFDWSSRSLVIFSCVEDGFFRTYSLQLPLRSRARRLNRPYVKPLVDLIDSYGHYGVALIDKQGARFFHFHLGVLTEIEGTLGEPVRHTKRGGGSQSPGRRGGTAGQTRYAEEVTERNLRDAANFADGFFNQKQVRRLLIGGTEENVAGFLDHLPKRWKCLVMGTFSIDRTSDHTQVLNKAMHAAKKYERDRESRLVESVITAAAKGREGVIRLGDTLGAVQAGNVQTLVISDGYRAPGFRCVECRFISEQKLKKCPFCSGSIEKIEDAVELAIRQVLLDGGEVEVLHDNKPLKKAGSIGAVLRY
jgi:hypothetical protein